MFPVVAIGLLVVLVLRSSQKSSTQADPCDQLEDPKAILACKLGRGVLGAAYDALRDAVAGEDRHIVNMQLNGPATEWWDSPDNDDAYYASSPRGSGGAITPTRYTDAQRGPNGERRPKRHENGCAPFPGHPDWAKCKPGTKPMTASTYQDPGHAARDLGPELGASVAAPERFGGQHYSADAVGSGDPQRDPLSFPWDQRPSSHYLGADAPHRRLEFPLDVPEGASAWIVRGEPVVCAPGTEVRGRDHRTGAETRSPCSAANQSTPPPIVPDETEPHTGCLSYYRADGTPVRDCREGATLPPGATTTPPYGRTGTVRISGTATTSTVFR